MHVRALALLAALAALAVCPAVLAQPEDEEAPVGADAVPAPVRAAAARILGQAPVVRWTKEVEDGVEVYEADFAGEGGLGSLSFSADGEFLEREERVGAVPAAVTKKIGALHPGATVEASEVVRSRWFEVKVRVGDKTHEMRIDAAGRVLPDDEDDRDDAAKPATAR
jgi:hypothetical protein